MRRCMVRRIPILAVVQPDLQPYYGRTQSTKQVTTVQDAKSRFRRCCQQMPGPHQISPGNQRCPMLLIIGGAGFHLGLWRRTVCKVSGRLLATLIYTGIISARSQFRIGSEWALARGGLVSDWIEGKLFGFRFSPEPDVGTNCCYSGPAD